jgi:peptidoglycan/LPS O-acetylase OafA/YrhL
MGRSILAIVAGFVLAGALNVGTNTFLSRVAPEMVPPPGTPNTNTTALLVICAYVALYGILGCYVTARLAPSRPLLHALIVGGLALAMSIPATIAVWNDTPVWFNVYNLLAVMPYAYVGGRIRERELARGPQGRLAVS